MSLLTICQDVATDIGFNRPTAIAGSTSTDALKLMRLVNKVGKKLMRKFDWHELSREQTFTALTGSEQTSILPDDFDRFIPETFWDRTNDQLVTGPITPQEWQGLKAISYTDIEKKFYRRRSTIYAIPDFTGGESLAFEYVSKNWCESSSGTGQAAMSADDDVSLFNEELVTLAAIFEYLSSAGLPNGKAQMDFKEAYDFEVKNNRPDGGVVPAGDIFGGGRHYTGTPPSSGSGGIY